jgi:oligopeptide/dipeptide ABC transporter ATP-binding protein
LYARPSHPYTQALLASVPVTHPGLRKRGGGTARLAGDIPSAMSIPPGCRFHTRCPYVMDICRTTEPAMRPAAPGHEAACHLLPG